MTATDDLGCSIFQLCIKSCIGLEKAVKSREIRVHKVNRRLVIFRE